MRSTVLVFRQGEWWNVYNAGELWIGFIRKESALSYAASCKGRRRIIVREANRTMACIYPDSSGHP